MKLFRWTGILLACALLAACAAPRDSVVFVTKTSLGFDVEGAPSSVSLAYDRTEGYFGPRYDTGTLPPVVGYFRTNGGLFDRQVKQTYATGNAANIVTSTATTASLSEEHYQGERKEMFFGTGTVLGIKLGFTSTGIDAFTLGFKRKEISVIPVSASVTSTVSGGTATITHRFPSVLASFDNTTAAKTADGSELGIRQFFATGRPAEQLALNTSIREGIRDQAADMLVEYRNQEREQTRQMLAILSCLSKVADAKLADVWQNAGALSVFNDSTVPAALTAAQPAQAARTLYTQEITLTNGKSVERTVALGVHRKYVCQLGGLS